MVQLCATFVALLWYWPRAQLLVWHAVWSLTTLNVPALQGLQLAESLVAAPSV